MTLVVLPNTSVTGANLWSQVEDNDKAIRDVVNGDIDATNLADDAVTTPKIDDAAVTTSKLAGDAVDGTKLADDAVDTEHIADDAVEAAQIADSAVGTAQIADGAVTGGKLAASTTGTAVNEPSVNAGTITARLYPGGLVLLSGGVIRTSGSWAAGTTIATLPVGFRPASTQYGLAWSSLNGANAVQVATSGAISVRSGFGAGVSATSVYLDGLTFHIG